MAGWTDETAARAVPPGRWRRPSGKSHLACPTWRPATFPDKQQTPSRMLMPTSGVRRWTRKSSPNPIRVLADRLRALPAGSGGPGTRSCAADPGGWARRHTRQAGRTLGTPGLWSLVLSRLAADGPLRRAPVMTDGQRHPMRNRRSGGECSARAAQLRATERRRARARSLPAVAGAAELPGATLGRQGGQSRCVLRSGRVLDLSHSVTTARGVAAARMNSQHRVSGVRA
jgi:hypothetical protein